MDKIVVLVLLIAVTLGLFSHSILGQAANAREFVDFADEEQTRVRILMTNPDVVTGETALSYFEKGYTVRFEDESGEVKTPDYVNERGYYRINREYQDGQLYRFVFTEVLL